MSSELLTDGRADRRTGSRERTAARLLEASGKTSYDPVVHIDWEAPLPRGRYYTPPHRCSLYGTHLWERLSEEQRIELTKHEVASIASMGIWFETILMQMLVRHAYDREPTSSHVQYAYTEIGDECRHSVMFAKMIDRIGAPYYRPLRLTHFLGRIFKQTSNGTMTFAGALFVEEILDQLQREAMTDETLQPLVQAVSRVHVVEEARHMRYAREAIPQEWTRMSPARRAWTRFVIAEIAYITTTQLVNEQVYAAVGLEPRSARKVAEANPHWRETRKWAARKVVATFEDAGLLAGRSRGLWQRAGLVD
ncbi:MAG: AurF N-oxygenase family protein [Nocardioidaceae bacterium]